MKWLHGKKCCISRKGIAKLPNNCVCTTLCISLAPLFTSSCLILYPAKTEQMSYCMKRSQKKLKWETPESRVHEWFF